MLIFPSKIIAHLRDPSRSHLLEVIRGTLVAFSLRAAGVGLHFLLNILLAHLLGAEGAGLYFLAFGLCTVSATFARIGLDIGLLRFVAALVSERDWDAVKGATRAALGIVFLTSVLVALLVFQFAPWISQFVFGKPELLQLLRWISLAIVPLALLGVFAEMLKGLKAVFASVLVQAILVPGLSCIGLVVLAPKWGPVGASMAFTIAVGAATTTGWWLWHRATPNILSATPRFDIKRLVRIGPPILVVALAGLLLQWTSPIVLGIYEATAEVGVFTVALRTALLVSFLLSAANAILAPKFAELYQRKDITALASLTRTAALGLAVAVSPVVVVFLAVPDLVMSIYGEEFTGGGSLLAVLAVGQFIYVATGAVGFLLMMTGYQVEARNTAIAGVSLNIMLNFILIPMFGALGAAIATSVSMAATNIFAVLMVRRRLGFWPVAILPSAGHRHLAGRNDTNEVD